MSKFSEKRKSKSKNTGKAIVTGPGPVILVKLKEQWTNQDELWPICYVGPTFPINRLIKFLASQGLTQPQLALLKKGVAVGAKIGDQVRMFQIVSPESESGTFRFGESGLEPIPHAELMAKAQAEVNQSTQKDQHGQSPANHAPSN